MVKCVNHELYHFNRVQYQKSSNQKVLYPYIRKEKYDLYLCLLSFRLMYNRVNDFAKKHDYTITLSILVQENVLCTNRIINFTDQITKAFRLRRACNWPLLDFQRHLILLIILYAISLISFSWNFKVGYVLSLVSQLSIKQEVIKF